MLEDIHCPKQSDKNDIPKIAKIRKIKRTTSMTSSKGPMELNKADKIIFRLSLCDINLKGLKILNNLKI